MEESLLFNQVFDKIFVPDPYGRFSCKQISLVLGEYFDSINRPELKLTAQQVGVHLSMHNELDRTRYSSILYHVSVRPEWPVSATLQEKLGKTSVKKYTKSFIRVGDKLDGLS